jgi:PKD repeat protein
MEYLNYAGKNLTFRPKINTSYEISLYVIDALGRVSPYNISMNVSYELTASINYTYDPVDTQVNDSFQSVVTGGFPGYRYNWVVYPIGISIGNRSSLNYTFQKPGNYTLKLTVEDSIGDFANATLNVTVNEYPRIINFTQEYGAIDYYMYDYYYLNMTGGTLEEETELFSGGLLSMSFYFNGSFSFNSTMVNMSNNSNHFYTMFPVLYYPHLNSSAITVNITIIIYDYGGASLSYNFTLTINPPLNAKINIYPSANITVNDTVYLNASVSGGTAPYNFTWYITLPNYYLIKLYGQNIRIEATQSGTYSIQLIATDIFGLTELYSNDIVNFSFKVGG